jgi:integrase
MPSARLAVILSIRFSPPDEGRLVSRALIAAGQSTRAIGFPLPGPGQAVMNRLAKSSRERDPEAIRLEEDSRGDPRLSREISATDFRRGILVAPAIRNGLAREGEAHDQAVVSCKLRWPAFRPCSAASTGNDPELDALLLRLHFETACRRGGALALTPTDLDHDQCLALLREKGDTMRWQPVSPTLMSYLIAHTESRGGLDSGQRLFRYANGRSITARRYDYLWQRLGKELPWVATQQVSTHWMRHTILTWVERNFGFTVAQAYADHEDHGRSARTMATYIRAGLPEVAMALPSSPGEPESGPGRATYSGHRCAMSLLVCVGGPYAGDTDEGMERWRHRSLSTNWMTRRSWASSSILALAFTRPARGSS